MSAWTALAPITLTFLLRALSVACIPSPFPSTHTLRVHPLIRMPEPCTYTLTYYLLKICLPTIYNALERYAYLLQYLNPVHISLSQPTSAKPTSEAPSPSSSAASTPVTAADTSAPPPGPPRPTPVPA